MPKGCVLDMDTYDGCEAIPVGKCLTFSRETERQNVLNRAYRPHNYYESYTENCPIHPEMLGRSAKKMRKLVAQVRISVFFLSYGGVRAVSWQNSGVIRKDQYFIFN